MISKATMYSRSFTRNKDYREHLDRIHAVIHDMVHDRGFTTLIKSVRHEDIEESVAASENLVEAFAPDGVRQCVVMGLKEIKIGVKSLRDFEEMKQQNPSIHVIVLSEEKPTPPAAKKLQDKTVAEWLSYFTYSEVIENIMHHSLISPHRKVPEEDIERVLRPWRESSCGKLPTMIPTDPVARYMGFVEGDVVETWIKNGSDEKQIFYCRVMRR